MIRRITLPRDNQRTSVRQSITSCCSPIFLRSSLNMLKIYNPGLNEVYDFKTSSILASDYQVDFSIQESTDKWWNDLQKFLDSKLVWGPVIHDDYLSSSALHRRKPELKINVIIDRVSWSVLLFFCVIIKYGLNLIMFIKHLIYDTWLELKPSIRTCWICYSNPINFW